MPGEAELAAGGQISGDMAAEIQCGITAQAVPSRRGAPGAGILLLTWSSKRLSTVIKRLREEKGLTPEELATRARVDEALRLHDRERRAQEVVLTRPEAPRQGPRRAGDGAAGMTVA